MEAVKASCVCLISKSLTKSWIHVLLYSVFIALPIRSGFARRGPINSKFVASCCCALIGIILKTMDLRCFSLGYTHHDCGESIGKCDAGTCRRCVRRYDRISWDHCESGTVDAVIYEAASRQFL